MGDIRRHLFNWFFFLLFLGMAIVMSIGLLGGDIRQKSLDDAELVEDVFTKKGLYLGNQYYVRLVDGTEQRIFKHTYLNLEKGEVFQSFFESFSIIDFFLYISVFVFMIGLFFLLIWLFAGEIFRDYRGFQKFTKWKDNVIQFFTKRLEKRFDLLKRMTILLTVSLLFVSLAFVMKNTVHKMMPIGKTNAIAHVIDHSSERLAGNRYGPTHIYTITYKYSDRHEQKYETEKRVSKITYDLYKDQQFINISYRDRAPYDTFIRHQKMSESIAPLFSKEMLIIIVASYLGYFLARKYVKQWGIPFRKCNG